MPARSGSSISQAIFLAYFPETRMIESLRNGTKIEHQQLDQFLVPEIRRILTRGYYIDLLVMFFGFIKPVQDNIDVYLDDSLITDYPLRRRPERILNDIEGSMLESIKHEVLLANADSLVEFILRETPPVIGDKTMLYQIFANLIGNAVKYCKESTKPVVEVVGQETATETLYMIKDNGIGMGMHHGDQIFELFKRLDNAAKYEGTGVGLAIVKRIMEKHRARIWYESALSQGTTFFLAFGR